MDSRHGVVDDLMTGWGQLLHLHSLLPARSQVDTGVIVAQRPEACILVIGRPR
jgi:hypothetical protein